MRFVKQKGKWLFRLMELKRLTAHEAAASGALFGCVCVMQRGEPVNQLTDGPQPTLASQ